MKAIDFINAAAIAVTATYDKEVLQELSHYDVAKCICNLAETMAEVYEETCDGCKKIDEEQMGELI